MGMKDKRSVYTVKSRKYKLKKNTKKGAGIFDFFTKKKSAVDKAWEKLIEDRQEFNKELELRITSRKKVCKDEVAKSTKNSIKELKRTAKLKTSSDYIKTLKVYKGILEKWDDKVITYAKELGETCGSYRVAQRKSPMMEFVEKRLNKEIQIEKAMKNLDSTIKGEPNVLLSNIATLTDIINIINLGNANRNTVDNDFSVNKNYPRGNLGSNDDFFFLTKNSDNATEFKKRLLRKYDLYNFDEHYPDYSDIYVTALKNKNISDPILVKILKDNLN